MKKILIMSILFFKVCSSQEKVDYVKERKDFNLSLIEKNDKLTHSKVLNSNEKFLGRFLGEVKTKDGVKYYIITNSFIFNIENSPTAENHIFIYNPEKECVGYYYLTFINELPTEILKNRLYFNDRNCKDSLSISFDEGIPSMINLICNDEDNYYEFIKYDDKNE